MFSHHLDENHHVLWLPSFAMMQSPSHGVYSDFQSPKHKIDINDPPAVHSVTPLPPGYLPPSSSTGSSVASRVVRAVVYSLVNFVLSLVAFFTVVFGLSLSIGFLPLACLGIVLFQLVVLAVESLARMDVAMANYILSSGRARLRLRRDICSGITQRGDTSLWQRLFFVSPWMLALMVYFMTVKFVLGIFSLVAVALAAGVPITAIATLGEASIFTDAFSYDDSPVGYVLTVIACCTVGSMLMPLATLVSRKLTEFVCCESEVEMS